MHFLVYLPSEHANAAETLASVGLGHLSEGAQRAAPVKGPDGEGTIYTWDLSVNPVYRPEQQEWVPAVQMGHMPAGRYQVGFSKQHPPTPRELMHPLPIDGRAVRFGDGQDWVLPKYLDIPYSIVRNEQGEWVYKALERYASFLLAVSVWHDRMSGECAGTPATDADLCDLVEQALSINYRLVPEVVNQLGLFRTGGSENLARAAAWILDYGETNDG